MRHRKKMTLNVSIKRPNTYVFQHIPVFFNIFPAFSKNIAQQLVLDIDIDIRNSKKYWHCRFKGKFRLLLNVQVTYKRADTRVLKITWISWVLVSSLSSASTSILFLSLISNIIILSFANVFCIPITWNWKSSMNDPWSGSTSNS